MEIIYSTKPVTAGNLADMQLAARGDYTAMIRLVADRTSLLESQVRNIELDALAEIIKTVGERIIEAAKLSEISRSWNIPHE